MIQSVITGCARTCSLLFVLHLPPSRCSWVPDASRIVRSRQGLFWWFFFFLNSHYLQNHKQAPLPPFFLSLKHLTLSKLAVGEQGVKSLLRTDPVPAPRAAWRQTWLWFHNPGLSASPPVPMGFSVGNKSLKGKAVHCGNRVSLKCWLLKAVGAQGR